MLHPFARGFKKITIPLHAKNMNMKQWEMQSKMEKSLILPRGMIMGVKKLEKRSSFHKTVNTNLLGRK